MPLALISGIVGVTFFYVLFISVYGKASGIVSFAFNRMAVFNLISDLLGATNFLSIMAWLIMAVLQITLIFYTVINAVAYFIKSKIWAIVLTIVTLTIIQWLFVHNIETAYVFATSFVKYFALACQIIIPVILAVYARKKSKENV